MPITPPRVSTVLTLACLGALVTGSVGEASAQETHEASWVLPKGQPSGTYTAAVPLPPGTEGVVRGVTFVKTDGTPLGGELRTREPSGTTTLAGRDLVMYVDVPFERATEDDDELSLRATVEYETRPATRLWPRSGPVEPNESVLASGQVVKLAVDEDGIYVIDAALLSDLDLPTDGGPGAVRLYTKGGAMLPERVGDDYPTDLQEVALVSQDNGDGRWDGGERLLFYGEGEDVWRWNEADGGWDRPENLYAEQTYYYLKVGGAGLRARSAPVVSAAAYDDTYTFRARWEEDLTNLLRYSQREYNAGQGSGQPWYGPIIDQNRSIERPGLWDLGAVPAGGSGLLKSELRAATNVSSGGYTVEVGSVREASSRISKSTWRDANVSIVKPASINAEVSLAGGPLDVTVTYPGNPGLQRAWIDYVQLNHDAVLAYDGTFTRFQRAADAEAGTYGFEVPAPSAETTVLDVSDAIVPTAVQTEAVGGGLRFGYAQPAQSAPREFVAFPTGGTFPRPTVVGEVDNSNLHALSSADMVIVYGQDLGPAAEKLAEHRRAFGGLETITVAIEPIFEEFGGGRPDPTALRNFMTMLRQRDPGLRYLLLMGDGHYDPRNIVEEVPSVLPTFQTKASEHEVTAFPTDDYFGLLDEGEGIADSTYPEGGLDVGIGRIPAVALSDAMSVVDKTIRYDTDEDMRGDWRLRNVFVADDEDNNRHLNDIEAVARATRASFPQYNQTKIYVDAYEQVSSSGGERYPRATEDINRNMFRGNLITTYLGHGGPRGWGEERFLDARDIGRWRAADALPILLTATCTFTGYDDPTNNVIGENVLFQRDGGVVASFSTVRPVYTNQNKVLTDSSLAVLLDRDLTGDLGIGELLNLAKNSGNSQNDRKYSLFGDPALKIAVPQLDVSVTEIDDVDVGELTESPAVAPLREVKLSGVVQVPSGGGGEAPVAEGFDGRVEFTVFDQRREATTLGNDSDSPPKEFGQLGATLFTGSATVTGGRWTARFMLPVDVSLSRGEGRVSLYATAEDGRDGAGVFTRFVVDGLAEPAVADQTPPTVEAFIGDDTFTEGGVAGTDPVLYVKLADDTGINVSGSAIGHDLTATLRGPDESTYVLNDFYEAATDDYRRGEARFPVYDLPEGEYELEVRAWDLANNTGVGRTSFLVSASLDGTLRRVLNYPNPMVDATCFQFEHSAAGRLVDVRVDIYTTSGRLVRSLDYAGLADGPRFGGGDDCISWDGTDEFGQRLGRGVYLYRVRLRAEGAEDVAESGFEKVVVLR